MTLAWIGFSAEALLAYRSPYIKDLNRLGSELVDEHTNPSCRTHQLHKTMLCETQHVQAATEDTACHAEHGGPGDSHPCGHLCLEVTYAEAPRSHPQSVLSTQVHMTCGHASHAAPLVVGLNIAAYVDGCFE
jgi:hypothetical protein